MTADDRRERPTPLREARPGDDYATMTDKSNSKRGEKRGVLETGRAQKLDKTTDADADADDDEEQREG